MEKSELQDLNKENNNSDDDEVWKPRHSAGLARPNASRFLDVPRDQIIVDRIEYLMDLIIRTAERLKEEEEQKRMGIAAEELGGDISVPRKKRKKSRVVVDDPSHFVLVSPEHREAQIPEPQSRSKREKKSKSASSMEESENVQFGEIQVVRSDDTENSERSEQIDNCEAPITKGVDVPSSEASIPITTDPVSVAEDLQVVSFGNLHFQGSYPVGFISRRLSDTAVPGTRTWYRCEIADAHTFVVSDDIQEEGQSSKMHFVGPSADDCLRFMMDSLNRLRASNGFPLIPFRHKFSPPMSYLAVPPPFPFYFLAVFTL